MIVDFTSAYLAQTMRDKLTIGATMLTEYWIA
jgi:hypothetical protein